MYSGSVIKQPGRGPNDPPGEDTESYMTLSPARSVLGRRKQGERDVFDRPEEFDLRTPTRPRRRPVAPPDTQMEIEVEAPIMAEAEAIVANQLENLKRELQKFSDHHVWGRRATEIAYVIARKFMPELIEAGEKYHADGKADSSRALQETAELRSTVKDLAKAVNTLVARQETLPTQNGDNQRGPTEVQGARTVIATGPVYKPTRTSPAHARPALQRQQALPRSPKDQYHPARLIVIPRGEKFDTNYLNPRRLVNLINDRLSRSDKAKHLCVASAHYNYNQNLVIMMREDQKGEELRQHAKEFVDILGVPATTIEMLTDDRRYKVRINGVWTGRDGETDLNTPEDLLEEIVKFNPIMSKVTLIGKPRWMRAETDLRRKDYSSVVLEFAKEEDAKAILATRYIAMYTHFCEVVHHADKPPVLQCSNCWTLGHHASRCKNSTRCRRCAGEHSETEHNHEEAQRMHEGEEEGTDNNRREAMNTNKCANCGGNHPATERSCPERKRFQMIAREKEGGQVEGGMRMRKRKGGKGREDRLRADGTDNTRDDQQSGGTAEKGGMNTNARTEMETRPISDNANRNTSVNVGKNTNRFMALENLLNQQERIDWAEEAMEGQESTERQTH
ncbi:hypothetical protein C0989_005090, partial [Termitomyces sp. Mn162]